MRLVASGEPRVCDRVKFSAGVSLPEMVTRLSVGDRYDIDIALPLELGMGGILVDGVEDVYRLPEILAR